jgi:endonuclease YncB( thermonuclease family)
MKIILIALILSLCCNSLLYAETEKRSVIYNIKVIRVIDGDTVAFEAKWLPDPLKKELAVRIYGVDTPEKGYRAKCNVEAKRGESSSVFTKSALVSARVIQLNLIGWDKYGGRVLGDLLLDGKSLRRMLIDNGFAREYYGEAKQSWCTQ